MTKNMNETRDVFVDTVLISDEVLIKKIKNINNNIKLSVVLSAYRKVSNLENIITQLLNQTYKNFEIIIVDDLTNNEIEKVFEQYSNCENINYIKKQLGSRAGAKNIAIQNSKGDYILFLEENIITIDDNYLEIMQGEIANFGADIVVLANDSNRQFLIDNFDNELLAGDQFLKKEFGHFRREVDSSLASFIFKRKFLEVNNIAFNNEMLEGENLYFKLQTFDNSNKIKISTLSSYMKKYSRTSRNNVIIESANTFRMLNTLKKIEQFSKRKVYEQEAKVMCGYSYLELLKNTKDKDLKALISKEIVSRLDCFEQESFMKKNILKTSPSLFVKLFLQNKEAN